jgi:hypothetical protein
MEIDSECIDKEFQTQDWCLKKLHSNSDKETAVSIAKGLA